jgi:hypothetical protein
MNYEELGTEDRETARRQLNRRLRGRVLLAARCPHGVVEVIATSPLLSDGTPFPTLFWLSCPLLQRAVSRLESGDFREILRRKLKEQPDFALRLRAAEREYMQERDVWAEEMGELDRVREYLSGREGGWAGRRLEGSSASMRTWPTSSLTAATRWARR